MHNIRKILSLAAAICLLVSPAQAVQTFMSSVFSKQSTAFEFLTPIETTIIVTTTAESWFALVNARVTNTTSQIVTVTMVLHESLLAVPDETIQLSLAPGTSTVQLPKQFQGTDLGVGPHTFQVKVNQDTNSPINYQVETYLGLFNNTGTGGGGGGGTGDVEGPGTTVIDRDVVVWDGTDGLHIMDPGFWSITTPGELITPGGSIGIGTATPVARLDIASAGTSPENASLMTCSGARTASQTCTQINEQSSSSTAGVNLTAQSIGVTGPWNGTSSRMVGTYYDVDPTSATEADAIFIQQGNLVTASEFSRVGLGDTTPDYQLEVENAGGTVTPFGITATGARSTSWNTAVISDIVTGGNSGDNNFGLSINVSGAFAGSNAALFLNASGAAEFNTALFALNGDIAAAAGDLSTFDGTMGATQSDQGQNAMSASCPSRAGGSAPCLNVQVPGDGSAGFRKGIVVDVDSGTGASAEAVGLTIDADGTGGLKAQGIAINAHGAAGATANEALAIDGGDFTFGGGGPGLRLAWATKHALFNNSSINFNTDAAVEIHSDTDDPAQSSICAYTTGGTCSTIDVSGAGSGSHIGQLITVAGGGGSASVQGLQISVSGAAGISYAMNVVSGDVTLGVPTISEYFHASDTNSQIIINKDSGTADDVGGNALEVHNDNGQIGIEVFGTGSGTDTGTSIASGLTGAVTAASTANTLSNTQTSSTNAINKTALSVASTGSFTGTGAINTGVSASATGGTLNYAVDALQGGMRSDTLLLKPQGSAPFTCATAHEGMIAYATTSKLVCVCSDSDGGTFEWEAIEDRTVTCTF